MQYITTTLANTLANTLVSTRIPKSSKKKIRLSSARKLLIIQPQMIGDTLVTLPTVHAIKQHNPSLQIDIITSNESLELCKLIPWINKKFIFPPSASLGKLIKDIRQENYDVIIDFQFTYISWFRLLLSPLSNAPIRLHGKRGGFRGLFPTHEFTWKRLPEPEQFMEAAKIMGIENKPTLIVEYQQKDNLWAQSNFKSPYIIIHANNKNPEKRYTGEGFAQVADELSKKGYTILFTGAEPDKTYVKKICLRMKKPSIDLCGKTTLSQFIALIKHAHLLVAVDTSAVHIAAATNTPTIALYGPTNPEFWYPYNKKCQVALHADPCCKPWFEDDFNKLVYFEKCKLGKNICIRRIPPSQIISIASKLLKKKKILK